MAEAIDAIIENELRDGFSPRTRSAVIAQMIAYAVKHSQPLKAKFELGERLTKLGSIAEQVERELHDLLIFLGRIDVMSRGEIGKEFMRHSEKLSTFHRAVTLEKMISEQLYGWYRNADGLFSEQSARSCQKDVDIARDKLKAAETKLAAAPLK